MCCQLATKDEKAKKVVVKKKGKQQIFISFNFSSNDSLTEKKKKTKTRTSSMREAFLIPNQQKSKKTNT